MAIGPTTPTVPLDLVLLTPQERRTPLLDVLTRPLTVVHLVRYFGCLPCQEWLIELDRAAEKLAEQGVGAIAVGGTADFQARWLQDEKGVRIPLLLDPDHQLREHLAADKPLGWRMADPRGAVAYARSLRYGMRPQKATRDTVRSPGVVILGQDGEVRWRFVGNRIGHYPLLDEVLAAVARLS